MNEKFRKKLIDSYHHYGHYVREKELEQIIRFGTRGEGGENYYLFLYRDFYRNSAYYGAIIFLNKKDTLENPVTIIGVEQNGKQQVREVFVKAALFFLKNEYQDTMTISGNAKNVFSFAKEIINSHIGEEKSTATTPVQLDIDLLNQDIRFKEIKPLNSKKNFKSRGLEKNLKRLTIEDRSLNSGENESIPGEKAKLGLCFVSKHLDLSGDRQFFFQPLILPVKNNKCLAKPMKVQKSSSLNNRYQWVESNKLLENFFTSYIYLESQPGNPRLKTELMNHMFFQRLSEEIFTLPDELTFYQKDSDKEYIPLKKAKFNKIMVQFAPSLKRDSHYRFFLTFYTGDGLELKAKDNFDIISFAEKLYISFTSVQEEVWFVIPDLGNQEANSYFSPFLNFLALQKDGFYINELDTIIKTMKPLKSKYITFQEKPLKKYELYFHPTPIFNIFPEEIFSNKPQYLEVQFDYQTQLKTFVHQNPDKMVCIVPRAKDFEDHILQVLKSDPFLIKQMDYDEERKSVIHHYHFKDNDFFNWLITQGKLYLEKGIKIYSVKWKRFIAKASTSLKIKINTGIDWLEFKPYIHDPVTGMHSDISLDEEEIPADMVIDRKGKLHMVTRDEIDRLNKLYRYAVQHGNSFRIPSRNYILLRKLYNKEMEEIPEIKKILSVEERLKEFEQIDEYQLSPNFNGRLRDYQYIGFKWLYFLKEYRFSGCLADDMGLGKTIQTLALLQTLKDEKKLNTSLLVAPVSAIPNWEAEIVRFSPGLNFYRHMGTNRDKSTREWKGRDIVITSYATMRNDIEELEKFEFDYIILDESQNIKNPSSQVSQAAKILKAKNRLALSGTPIENNSMELWSLFDFLMPGFMGNYQWFNRHLAQGIEKERDEEKIQLLKKMVYPFILRRKKQEVEKELPEKIEIVSALQMEEEQTRLYAERAKYYREILEKEIDDKGVTGSSIKILEGMLRLRQLCLFPSLLDEKYAHIPSAKFNYFKELLEDILSEDHKVLIFSQFVQVLHRIKEYCDDEKIIYSYIDGSIKVNQRKKMVKSFQEEEKNRIFLLSLKAGGVALNLTAADYVIIFDPWWNPAVEAQAIDRSHRIGQTKKVIVYRMVVKESIEEKILSLQERKKELVENLIASDSLSYKDLNKKDILNLFK